MEERTFLPIPCRRDLENVIRRLAKNMIKIAMTASSILSLLDGLIISQEGNEWTPGTRAERGA